ncbi:uncharacterized protein LOC131855389 [Achroia grisella]|uniref:uncharacterized protein LOC131855389 n=1 Tax=Achroia grisella TaxID=688607 RepID=UPI0027D34391|nr:uncharacterized protein LOC131855389 [Achroia grisella]
MAGKLLTLALGVVLLAFASCDTLELEESLPEEQPMETQVQTIEKRRLETPEVVLQLKYDGGELNRIYLAQFRKGMNTWTPSVPARKNLCADLCHAGLGGEVCGAACHDLIPIGLQSALTEAVNTTDVAYGHPRFEVCPTLCDNYLGEPLCNCAKKEEEVLDKNVDWIRICAAFCIEDHYVLGGCPPCEQLSSLTPKSSVSSRTLNTADGWSAWCDAQCRQGQGGAACNCDRTPFQ